MARFADEDLIIDFDNFVRCLIRLETLFSEYMLSNHLEIPAELSMQNSPEAQDKVFRQIQT